MKEEERIAASHHHQAAAPKRSKSPALSSSASAREHPLCTHQFLPVPRHDIMAEGSPSRTALPETQLPLSNNCASN